MHEAAPTIPLLDWSAGLAGVGTMPRATRRDVSRAIALAQRFNAEVIRPMALRLDAAVQDDPDALAHDYIAEANRWGLYAMWLPKMFGGSGWNLLSLYAFIEEISTECVGLANTLGVHYLGVSTLMGTWNMKLISRIFGEVSEGSRTGRPCLISLAITEPGAGTDVEECELVDRARLGTEMRPQPDGSYVIDGRKVFISNGHVSTWHMVIGYEDRKRAADTTTVLAVRTGTPGFNFGGKENKMGQKACVASELIFDGCRVPADQVALSCHTSRVAGRPHRVVAQTLIDYVVSSTRAGVGAFATGTARGAYLAARDFAARKHVLPSHTAHTDAAQPPARLIEQQWAQTLLAEMAKNALMGRAAYLESAMANSLCGLFQITFVPLIYTLDHAIPRALMRAHTRVLFKFDAITRLFQRRYLGTYPAAWQELSSGLGSLAKVACSDIGIINAHLALDLMGPDGLRHDHGVEKRLRDAKLLQIYEGTNQLNRVNLFKCMLRPDASVRVFLREGAQ